MDATEAVAAEVVAITVKVVTVSAYVSDSKGNDRGNQDCGGGTQGNDQQLLLVRLQVQGWMRQQGRQEQRWRA